MDPIEAIKCDVLIAQTVVPSSADQFSPLNIGAGFDTSGLMAVWDLNGGGNGGTPVPEPGMLGLLGFGLAGLAATRRRER